MNFTTRFSIAWLVLCGFSGCDLTENYCGPAHGVVERVIDGDTIELSTGEIIRYVLIDTPELSGPQECYAREAKVLNADLVLGREVKLLYPNQCTDKHSRLLASLFINNREINLLLIERGYACVLDLPPTNTPKARFFLAQEKKAKSGKRGLWGACERTPC